VPKRKERKAGGRDLLRESTVDDMIVTDLMMAYDRKYSKIIELKYSTGFCFHHL